MTEAQKFERAERMRALGAKGGAATKRKYGTAHLKAIGAIGGKQTAKRAPKNFYRDIGRMGNYRLTTLIAAGELVVE